MCTIPRVVAVVRRAAPWGVLLVAAVHTFVPPSSSTSSSSTTIGLFRNAFRFFGLFVFGFVCFGVTVIVGTTWWSQRTRLPQFGRLLEACELDGELLQLGVLRDDVRGHGTPLVVQHIAVGQACGKGGAP